MGLAASAKPLKLSMSDPDISPMACRRFLSAMFRLVAMHLVTAWQSVCNRLVREPTWWERGGTLCTFIQLLASRHTVTSGDTSQLPLLYVAHPSIHLKLYKQAQPQRRSGFHAHTNLVCIKKWDLILSQCLEQRWPESLSQAVIDKAKAEATNGRHGTIKQNKNLHSQIAGSREVQIKPYIYAFKVLTTGKWKVIYNTKYIPEFHPHH